MTLGKRKRNKHESTVSSIKRREMTIEPHTSGSSCSVGNPFGPISTPAPPVPTFPFFLLPAELRNQIWSHLYDNLTIHVSLKFHNKLASTCRQDLFYTLREKQTYPYHEAAFHLPPLVCKQFYTEATAALYTNCTFSFDSPHVFRAFALSNHACVSKLQHITIPRLTKHWIDALVCSLVGRLTSLRGVHLHWRHLHCTPNLPLPEAKERTWRGYWTMIRAFEQHELEKGRTRAELEVMNVYRSPWDGGETAVRRLDPGMERFEEMAELQKVFTEGLLEFTPRRVSRRGTRSR